MPQAPRFRGIIFDMDGTITRPVFDFDAIRQEIGLVTGDIAKEIEQLPPEKQRPAWDIIRRHEAEALKRQKLQVGTKPLLNRCRKRGIKIGLLTRNTQASVDQLCTKFNLEFDAVITREYDYIKPHPAPVLHMTEAWGIKPADTLVVGDYIHDLDCGRAAGARTCYFHNPGCPDFSRSADMTVTSMPELANLCF